MRIALLLALLLSAGAFAGCLSGTDEPDGRLDTNTEEGDEDPLVDTTDPMQDTGRAGGSAHKHDYWAGRTEVVLVDQEFDAERLCGWWTPFMKDNRLHHGCIDVQMGNGTTVYQGTSKLTVLATWSDPKVTGLSLFYRDAQKAHSEPVDIASGTPLEIPVTLETADMPHSKASKWAFAFVGGGTAAGGAILEKVHITITITRGLDLPLDPPHPDFWGAASSMELANVSGVREPPKATFLVFVTDGEGISLPEGSIVPPGTRTLHVQFTYKVKDPAPGIIYDVRPLYKTAEHPFWNRPMEWEGETGSGSLAYTIEVDPAMTDSPYATQSQWRFEFLQYHLVGTENAKLILPTAGIGDNPISRSIEYTLTVVATGDDAAMA